LEERRRGKNGNGNPRPFVARAAPSVSVLESKLTWSGRVGRERERIEGLEWGAFLKMRKPCNVFPERGVGRRPQVRRCGSNRVRGGLLLGINLFLFTSIFGRLATRILRVPPFTIFVIVGTASTVSRRACSVLIEDGRGAGVKSRAPGQGPNVSVFAGP